MLSKPADWQFFNKAMCQEFGISEGQLRKLLKELTKYGLVVRTKRQVTGKIEWITEVYESLELKSSSQNSICTKSIHTKSIDSNSIHTKSADILSTDYNQVLNKLNTDNKTFTNVNGLKAEIDYGNQDINLIFNFWEKIVGYPITSKKQANRNACNNLLKKYTSEQLQQLIRAVAYAHTQKYAPQISDIAGLQSKLNELLRWGKTNISNGGQSETRIID
jgi:hypothetical protein